MYKVTELLIQKAIKLHKKITVIALSFLMIIRLFCCLMGYHVVISNLLVLKLIYKRVYKDKI